MMFIFFKRWGLIFIFIKIVMLKVFFKVKKINECFSNILVLFCFVVGIYFYGIYLFFDIYEWLFVGIVV